MAKLECSFFSYTMTRMMNATIILPTPTPGQCDGDKHPTHKPAAKYPVIYLLHGYCGDYSVWARYSSMERYAEENNIAIVTISGENKFYTNHAEGDKYYDLVTKELPDLVCGLFPISKRREDTYIAGLSMGGYGALLHALSKPKKYCAFGAFSAGLAATGLDLPANASVGNECIDMFKLLERYSKHIADFPKGYMSCGTDDFLYEANVLFKDRYIELGGDLCWAGVPGYKHEWAFWDRELLNFIKWLPRTDAYAQAAPRAV